MHTGRFLQLEGTKPKLASSAGGIGKRKTEGRLIESRDKSTSTTNPTTSCLVERRVRGIAGDNASGRSLTQIPKASHHECPNDRSTPNRQLSSQCPRNCSALLCASGADSSGRRSNAPTNAIYNARCGEEEGKEERRQKEDGEKERGQKGRIEEEACVRELRQWAGIARLA